MCLGLHFVSLVHGQQSVEVLRLRAHIVKQTGCKCFWILKPKIEKQITGLKTVTFSAESRKRSNVMFINSKSNVWEMANSGSNTCNVCSPQEEKLAAHCKL